jgi:hypothetical protein
VNIPEETYDWESTAKEGREGGGKKAWQASISSDHLTNLIAS